MRKRTASGKSTSCWRLSFWRFSIGFRIITALFHMKKASFVYQDKRGFFLLSGQKTSKYMQFRASERSIGFSGARFFVFSGENGLKMLVSFLRFFADAKNA